MVTFNWPIRCQIWVGAIDFLSSAQFVPEPHCARANINVVIKPDSSWTTSQKRKTKQE